MIDFEGSGMLVAWRATNRGCRSRIVAYAREIPGCSCYCTGKDVTDKRLQLRIGNVTKLLKECAKPELVPRNYLPKSHSQIALQHLRWMLQKDALKQDMYLIGSAGFARRHLVMQYLELTNREYEYLALTRDTTESDIKQRREIREGNATYINQSAVRAALEGRVLVVEGVEKAERNVMPILNNLLENREMQLDDGRFLVAAARYDKLRQEHTLEELQNLNLLRVSEDFSVIALGLPVPKYRGHTLDPPLRSRFQARHIGEKPFKDHYEVLAALAPNVGSDHLSQLTSFVYGLMAEEAASLSLPEFPVDNLLLAAKLWNLNPHLTPVDIVQKLYPYTLFLKREALDKLKTAFEAFGLQEADSMTKSVKKALFSSADSIGVVEGVKPGAAPHAAAVNVMWNGNSVSFPAACGSRSTRAMRGSDEDFVPTPAHDKLLAEMMLSHATHDFCLIGPKGSGKSVLVERFGTLLRYEVVPIMLYQDMTSRDLIQQRRMLSNGDTVWQDSPLVEAALNGHLAVLDGWHRAHHSTLAVLHRLIHDRELELFDGTRLMGDDRFAMVKQKTGLSTEELAKRRIFPIHPSFRIIALAEPPNVNDSKQQWLIPELLTMFLFHHVKPLPMEEEMNVLSRKVSNVPKEILSVLLNFVQSLRQTTDPNLNSVAGSLSTRQLLRIMRRIQIYPEEGLYSAIHKVCLSRFLPHLTRVNLNHAMEQAGIVPNEWDSHKRTIKSEIKNGEFQIGDVGMRVFQPENNAMVPDILFYDNAEHLRVMEDMMKDFLLGEDLLLVGNQGVGKNKIADRFLQMLNCPRQYIQLHRDTTVQTLTLTSSVQDGILVYEDSPLVKAVKLGHVLVVDEGDKAPTHVTCILKSLVEAKHMRLADGRRIVPPDADADSCDPLTIRMHPNFRMFVLANRPGFPFLGNDFYSSLGDLFACHAVDNPNLESELSMLRQYGPNVSEDAVKKLSSAFSELRTMADEGLISYPYSTRELVNIVRHLENFPHDGLPSIVRNVFDFDQFSKDTLDTVFGVLRKHGIPVDSTKQGLDVKLAQRFQLPAPTLVGQWGVDASSKKQELPVRQHVLELKGPYEYKPSIFPLDRVDLRTDRFTEQQASWQLPFNETNFVSDVAADGKENIYVSTANPISLYHINPAGRFMTSVDVFDFFPRIRGRFRPRVKLAVLEQEPFKGCVVMHEEMTNRLLLLRVPTQHLHMLELGTKSEVINDTPVFPRLLADLSRDNVLCLYEHNGRKVQLLDMTAAQCRTVDVPFNMLECHLITRDRLLLKSKMGWHVLSFELGQNPAVTYLKPANLNIQDNDFGQLSKDLDVTGLASRSIPDILLSQIMQQSTSSPNRLLALGDDCFGGLTLGFPELQGPGDFLVYRKGSESKIANTSLPFWVDPEAQKFVHPASRRCVLPQTGHLVRALPTWKVPERAITKESTLGVTSGYLEAIDFVHRQVSYIPVPGPQRIASNTPWLCTLMEGLFVVAPWSGEGVVTADASGGVRIWETSMASLHNSFAAWERMLGKEGHTNGDLKLTLEQAPRPINLEDLQGPKHGIMDPTGMPHVGGNTFAGGTGGRDTAGLGGVGGPYRLDGGGPVFQVPESVKQQVPEHIREKAREMAKKAYQQRLKEIQMSEYDADMYEKFLSRVEKQISALRVILDSLQAKSKERQWVRHQTTGDLDEGKLIEGITGEKTVYRRRADKEPEPGAPLEKPKRLRLCPDLSGSMYRFNGYDARLQKTLEASLMVMEALSGYEDRFKYDIVGHSGEVDGAVFVEANRPPKNNKERHDVLKMMLAHSQFCYSGDNTFEATQLAVKELAKENADEYFAIVLSDANFERYGLSPKKFAELMTADSRINVFAIFIGSLGDQAARLKRQLPTGRAFICKETSEIPQILQEIFTSTLLASLPDSD